VVTSGPGPATALRLFLPLAYNGPGPQPSEIPITTGFATVAKTGSIGSVIQRYDIALR